MVVGDVGGGFGMKTGIYPEDVVVAWAAKQLGRPVKWQAERVEDFLAAVHGRSQISHAELALDAQGLVLALRVRTLANVGAYPSGTSLAIPLLIGPWVSTSIYHVPLVSLQISGVLTHNAPTGAYRGAGRPEAIYLIERLMDEAARQTGIDRIALRRRNFVQPAQMPYKNAMGQVYDSGQFERILDQGLLLSDWAGFDGRRAATESRGKLRGRGIATFLEWTGGNALEENVRVDVTADGFIELTSATMGMGQGIATSYVQLAHDVFGVPLERISLRPGADEIGFRQAFLFLVPEVLLHAGGNTLEFALKPVHVQDQPAQMGPKALGLSEIWFGPRDQLEAHFRTIYASRVTLTQITAITALLITLFAALLWLARPSETLYGWFSLGVALWMVYLLHFVWYRAPLNGHCWLALIHIALAGSLLCVQRFCRQFLAQPRNHFDRFLGFAALIIGACMVVISIAFPDTLAYQICLNGFMRGLLLLLKQSRRELVRIVHPNVVNPVVLGGTAVSDRVMQSVIAFMMIYGATLVVLTMLMLFTGLDIVTALTAVIACVNNIGPGLGDVGPALNYGSLTDVQTWICTVAMLLGRLELLSVLVLFTPAFWRR